ncbi:hypothetical protein CDL12_30573 [Handroanthus impetiginosus]|uniref:Uncharacterized protein n=1 Tax=Handroanthus impetiginosus TaxID=429701 RepID=A0A2G9FV13_9LAMI|nr:hypothetical protein CDL12_30573 [Handroanthus impetiginosus]
MEGSKSCEDCLRLTADHFRVTEPVNMDQSASKIMAPKTHNLYFPLPNSPTNPDPFLTLKLAGELVLLLLPLDVVWGLWASSSLISAMWGINNL